MEVKTFDLTEEQLKTFLSYDRSVTQHSVELTHLLIRADQLKASVAVLYEGRNKFVHERIREIGLDPDALQEFKVDTSGKVTVVLADRKPPRPQAPPPNGSAS